MVLQANALSQNGAAAPLTKAELARRHFRTTFQAAASRRRARSNGGLGNTRYIVEQAKRRSIIKSPTNTVRMSFPIVSRLPNEGDVAMKDAPPVPAGTPRAVDFPMYLGRPDFVEVPRSSIEAIDTELANADVRYIRDTLMSSTMGPSMYPVLRRYTAKDKDALSTGTLPREITIIIEDMTSILPTHMMAVHGPRPKNTPEARTKVTLYPVHSLILAAHCANLPAFPAPSGAHTNPNTPRVEAAANAREIELPVRPLCLHSPKTFPILLEYLYLRRPEVLLRHLVPMSLPTTLVEVPEQHESVARVLGTALSVQGLVTQITIVHGIWQNACALGVFDDELWSAIDFAWKLLLMSLAVATNMPDVLESIKNAECNPDNEKEVDESSTATDRQESTSS
ncbi:hypothetical protein NP233_g8655 [Leucocoprinus birnbaumii]|uniref:Uncharacterized protein n=1 Tax=Leucocoprinus birnbaumii TaxID=56174 RepID=A0AAD5VLZ0_9AGAR|nr:hypothetical protein NP233_g8655 [Leucocoprinus birnbaumii]